MSLHSRLAPAAVTVLTVMSCTIRVIQPPASPGPAQAGPAGAGGGAGPGAVRPDTSRPQGPRKPWKGVTKDTRIVSGLFTAYLKTENVHVAPQPEQIEPDSLMATEPAEST